RRSPLAAVVAVTLAVPRLPFRGREFEVIDQLVLLGLRVLEALNLWFAVLRSRDDDIGPLLGQPAHRELLVESLLVERARFPIHRDQLRLESVRVGMP